MSEVIEHKVPDVFKSFVNVDALVVRSPGRINLIGEHTDYNNGFVLPGSIDKAVYVTAEKNNTDYYKLYSVDFKESFEIHSKELKPIHGHWATYILGVVAQYEKKGQAIPGFDMNVYGDVPLGAGLSSSAAIECATAFALDQLFGLSTEKLDIALMSQLAEHEYAGVMCGIMDQFASVFGKQGHVIRLDCRSLDYQYIPFNPGGFEIMLIDSRVKHSLASTEYNVRRAECEKGISIIQQKFPDVNSLRDVTINMIEESLDPRDKIYKRCRYVVEENQRLQDGCIDLEKGDLQAFGRKMFGSHEGLRTQYEVSCKELDILIDTVKDMGEVIGARMMGGGFGGCTINLVNKDAVEKVKKRVMDVYPDLTGTEPIFYEVKIDDGTSIINQ